jgi:signal peptidase I
MILQSRPYSMPNTATAGVHMRRRFVTALVRGPSMAPTLRDGDAVLARVGGRPPRPGDVVLARFPVRPDLLVVKRIVRPHDAFPDGGTGAQAPERPARWWLEGDNRLVTDDSRRYGPAKVEARVVLKWWPFLRRL